MNVHVHLPLPILPSKAKRIVQEHPSIATRIAQGLSNHQRIRRRHKLAPASTSRPRSVGRAPAATATCPSCWNALGSFDTASDVLLLPFAISSKAFFQHGSNTGTPVLISAQSMKSDSVCVRAFLFLSFSFFFSFFLAGKMSVSGMWKEWCTCGWSARSAACRGGIGFQSCRAGP